MFVIILLFYFLFHRVPGPQLVLANKTFSQVQSDWQAVYVFRVSNGSAMELNPSDIWVHISGMVSNSSAGPHGFACKEDIVLEGNSSASAFANLISSPDVEKRCRERLVFWYAAGKDSEMDFEFRNRNKEPLLLEPVKIPAGGFLKVRLSLEHEHALYGDYHPLLGDRKIEMKLGETGFDDTWILRKEDHKVFPQESLKLPPDRRDDKIFLSAPDSLYLDADLPGESYFRFNEIKVRYSTKMKLGFWYLIANGTEGKVHCRIKQYYEGTSSWKPLEKGDLDVQLPIVGRWAKFEKTFETQDQAMTLALDLRIVTPDAEIGRAWFDDIYLIAIENPIPVGP